MTANRVVVTGIGIRCAGADSAAEFWKNVQAGQCAVVEVQGLDIGDSECRVGGQVADLEYSGVGEAGDRTLQLLLAAVTEALADSGVDLDSADRSRVGVALGQCQPGFYEDGYAQFIYANADAVARQLGVTGPRIVISSACTAGAGALVQAAERIACGDSDIVIAGGVDQLLGPTWQGFSSLTALGPEGCEAYSKSSGVVLGEGAGVFVLESLENAEARGAEVLAELTGWGSSADAHHITAADPSGRGAQLAMNRALTHAGLTPADIDYVCGHGTGTQSNDLMEIKALRLIFRDRAPLVPLSSIKPMIGHTLGAAGAIEAAATVYALRDQMLPPTINFKVTDKPPELDFVPNTARRADIDIAMSNNYAFGGDNSSLIFARPGLAREPREPSTREVCITGVGAVGAIGSGYEQWRTALLEGRTGIGPITSFDGTGLRAHSIGELPELSTRGVATPGEWRHLDSLSRLSLTVARQAWTDAALRLTSAQRGNTAVILATATGPLQAITRFRDSLRSGEPSPVVFPNTVFTAASGHVCKALRLRGPRTTFSSGSAAAVQAIEYATRLVARGEVDHAVVLAVEEVVRLHLATPGRHNDYLTPGLGQPFQKQSQGVQLGSAGVAFVIEPVAQARERGARSYGRVLGCAVGGDALGPRAGSRVDADPRGIQWEAVLRGAMAKAGVTPEEIGYVAASANGVPELDSLETGLLSRVFGRDIPVSAPKAAVGETQGAGAAVAILAGLVALDSGVVPPTAGLTDPVGRVRVQHVLDGTVAMTKDAVLANAFALGGSYGAVVVGR
ncbi:3-oxoacyl-[acyl-carrier-protein] synthase II [Streptomyces sp. DvalAA-14]|uniref:beta-ketoacyl-[acyl-carrier-protein] synthase family protein n=1 Tax=unclassified Streptomyces TaxID=2593676 RepID=UPI00081B6A33|nr:MULTISPECIES: beta-ketoacyl-[acyl-carrier-protein] synthase family protein [unclassified Streptomyces]MYS21713.1 hypothetical protein [Streptomyces sp. SID4948]SCD99463.1 3-oxoacyl-[acyl-carrier-protein] synthase II [Streptomyces sp. DvalAA-14]